MTSCILRMRGLPESEARFSETSSPWPAPRFPPAAGPGCRQAPSDRLLAAPQCAAPPASLYQTTDQLHGGHYVNKAKMYSNKLSPTTVS